jgi:hypothetical protein
MKERHVGIFKEGDQYHAGDETARMGEKGYTPSSAVISTELST